MLLCTRAIAPRDSYSLDFSATVNKTPGFPRAGWRQYASNFAITGKRPAVLVSSVGRTAGPILTVVFLFA
jgi:hypothetical protein